MARARRHRARRLSWAAPPSRWPPGPPFPWLPWTAAKSAQRPLGLPAASQALSPLRAQTPLGAGSRRGVCCVPQPSPAWRGGSGSVRRSLSLPSGLLHGRRDPRPGSGWSLSIQPLLRVHSRAQMSEWEHRVTPPASQRSLSPGRPSFSHVCLLHSARSHGAPPRTGHSHSVPCLPCWWPVGTRPTPDGALGQRSRSKLAVAFGMQRDDRHLLTGG